MLRIVRGLVPALALAIAVPFAAGPAAADQYEAADLIFKSRHLDLVPKGTGVAYKFEHTVSDEKLMGKPFTDDVKIAVTDVNAEGQRVLDVTVFTGERQRPVQNYDGLTINPVFIWFLDKSVENFRTVAGGKQPYLKGRMKEAFVEKPKLEDVKVEFGGKTIDAKKVTIEPFVNDPNKHKMQGYENSKFSFVMSKDIPGYFYEMNADFLSTQAGTGKLSDRLSLVEAK
ncbi:MAG: hypothetical protein C0519_14530 [Hyphomicrobium sp.]|nr:hypothetical protein [Hyphomicrobium sp.]PPD06086.1 MAG: hypothetical protein CTY28_15170 [Hyphomicrobium sp.]